MKLRRAPAHDPDFHALTSALDAELRAVYGAVQDAYDGFNQLGDLGTAIVASDGDAAIGCGCFRQHDATTIEIKRMFVASEHRGRGVARSILGELEAWARELGYTAALLETGNLQTAAIALYERCGYEIVEPYGPYDGMTVSVCMRKRLA
jgi:GNAT superfamily N-acetyltransferase